MQDPAAAAQETQQPRATWLDENRRLTELITEARSGSIKAFDELYRCTARWLLSQVRRYVNDGQAEDVLAEVYLQVWKSLDRFDATRAAPGVWLAVIARSRALDHLRREKPHGHRGTSDVDLEDTLPDAEGPEQLLARTQQRRLVELTLAVVPLSPQERLLLGLAYFRDSTHQEISLLTGLPLGTVKTVLSRAQSKLRQELIPAARLAPMDSCRPQPSL